MVVETTVPKDRIFSGNLLPILGSQFKSPVSNAQEKKSKRQSDEAG